SKNAPARHRLGAWFARRGRWPSHCIADRVVERNSPSCKETPTMWFISLFRRPKQSRKRTSRNATPAYRKGSVVPRLDILEDRSVPSTGPLVAISVPDPLAACPHTEAWQHSTRDSEAEPWVAVNPTNPNNIVALWIGHDFAGTVASVTLDGGTTWQNVAIPGVADCTGGAGGGGPWRALAPHGVLYARALGSPRRT